MDSGKIHKNTDNKKTKLCQNSPRNNTEYRRVFFTNNQQLKLSLCYSVSSVMSFDNLVYNKAAVCLFLQIPILICLST